MVMRLLSETDAQEVERAVARVEARSATELVVAVVERSGDYLGLRALAAALWSVAAAIALLLFTPLAALFVVALELPIGLGIYAALGWPPLRRRLISEGAAELAVQQRAFAIFAERGLHRTRDRTGLLILVSELEHRVVILGDAGIHRRVGDDGWQEYVRRIVERVREGRARDGLLEVIAELEGLLAELAPRRPDDTNELSDRVVRG